MKKLFLLLGIIILFSSCGNKKYDGMILVDPHTNQRYMLEHSIMGVYFIKEELTEIHGKDTIKVFKYEI